MRPYLELCRIYLVPTALADSFAGFALAAVVLQEDEDPLPALLVAVMSVCLYSAGMVSNDLFDLEKDVGERANVAAAHPGVVKRLQGLAEEMRKELGDTGRPGSEIRPVGR